MKKGLIIHYTQTKQTQKSIDQFCEGARDYQWDLVEVKPQKPYPFPFKMSSFFRLFPLCVTNKPAAIQKLNFNMSMDYDVIVIGYQVWFLSPSLPMQALLQDDQFKKLAAKKNILCLVTCRNMWVTAVKKVKQQFKNMGVQGVKTQILCDLAPAWATFVTTPRWMLTGRKEAFWIFPQAGIAEKDFALSKNLGEQLNQKGFDELNVLLYSHRQTFSAVLMEKMGYPLFPFWARLIESLAPKENFIKDLMLVLFRLCLVATILALLPVAALMKVATSSLLGKQMDRYIDNLLQG